MDTKKLKQSELLKAEAWGLLWFFVAWKASSILVFFIFVVLTADASLIPGIALVPSAVVFWKVQKYYRAKYLTQVA